MKTKNKMNNLREKLKNTLLVDPEIKQKLLNISNWTEDIETTVQEVFTKYGDLEEKIIKDIWEEKWRLYLKSLTDIENIEKQKEFKELQKIEEKLKNI